jgi:hypothetical protein
MFRSLWFHKLLGLTSRSVRRRQAAQQRKPVRLALESLEDRVTPAGTVNVNAATATALQAAVVTANGDTTHSYVITLTGASPYNLTTDIDITNKLGVTIQGKGQTINAAPNTRDFTVESQAVATFKSVTLSGGNVTETGGSKGGGAILDMGGNVTLSGATVKSNIVTSKGLAQGGGVYVSGGGTLSILGGSVVQSNRAVGASGTGAGGEGGGIYVTGASTLTITGSSVTSNIAQGANSKGVVGGGGFAEGGGMFLVGGSNLTITSSSVTSNLAEGGNSATFFGGFAEGGGVWMTGGGGANATITGSGISSNQAIGGLGGKGAAGANSGVGTGGVGGGGLGGGNAEGGGAWILGTVNMQISASPFSGNSATGGLGGQGGTGGDSSVTFGGVGGTGGTGGVAEGGGLWSDVFAPNSTIVNSSFTGNTATGGGGGTGGTGGTGVIAGGKGGTGGTGGFSEGGGALLDGQTSIVNSTVATNQAIGGAGGLGGAGGTKNGGFPTAPSGVAGAQGGASGGGLFTTGFVGTGIRIINNTIFENTANGTGSTGGGLEAFGNSTLINSIVLSNFAASSPDSNIGGANNFFTPGTGLPVLGGPLSTTTGVVYYPLLPGTFPIDHGTNTVLEEIAKAEGVVFNPLDFSDIKDIAGNLRVTSQTDNIDIGAVEFVPSLFSTLVAVTPATINTSPDAQFLTVQATVTSTSGVTVIGGTVTFQVTDSKGTPIGGPTAGIVLSPSSPNVYTGVLSIPANIKPGTYTITATYNDPFIGAGTGQFAPGVGTATLVVNPASSTFPSTLTPGSASVTTSASSQSVGIAVLVNSPGGPVNTGTVTISLLNNGVPIATASNSVSGGSTTVNITVPGGLAAGTYTLQESYHDAGGTFLDSSAFGTLTVKANATSLTAGNASVPFSSKAQPAGVPVLVSSPSGTVNQGSVTVTLLNNGVPVASASNTVSGGSTVVTITVPAGLASGTYTMQEVYHDAAGVFADSSAFGQLTIQTPPAPPPAPAPSPLPVSVTNNVPTTTTNPPSQFQALVSLFFDGALLALQVKQGLDTSALIAEMNTLIPFAGPLGPMFELAGFAAIMNSGK